VANANFIFSLLGLPAPKPKPVERQLITPFESAVPLPKVEPLPKPPEPPVSLDKAANLAELNTAFGAAERGVRNSPDEWQRLNQEYILNFARLYRQ
jgi:hypothetical protein